MRIAVFGEHTSDAYACFTPTGDSRLEKALRIQPLAIGDGGYEVLVGHGETDSTKRKRIEEIT